MFAIVKNGVVQKIVFPNQGFTYEGQEYPASWVQLLSAEHKASLGIVDAEYEPRPNDKYYWVAEGAPRYDGGSNKAIVSFTKFPKDVAQLKTTLSNEVNATAYSILLPSDWMAVKAYETGTEMDTAWKTWRQSIREQAATQIAAINACTTCDALAELPGVEWAKDPNAPVEG
jgi:hypothetical protein